MLSLVHGPIDIVARDPGDYFLASLGSGAVVWVEGVGLLAVSDWQAHAGASLHLSNLYTIRLDGSAIRVSSRQPYWALGWHFNAADPTAGDLPLVGGRTTTQRMRVPATLPVEAAWGYPAGWGGFVDLADRVLWFWNGKIRTGVRNVIAGTDEAAIWLGGAGPLIPADLGAKSLWYAVDTASGRVALYDAIAKAEIVAGRTGFGSAVGAAAYSRKHGLFFVVRRDSGRSPPVDQLYVYANEPVAASVSAPTLSGSPLRGRTYTASARVLGDLGEPCAGRVVVFTATHGSVVTAGVETDATGWARTTYRAPLAATGGVGITATLTE